MMKHIEKPTNGMYVYVSGTDIGPIFLQNDFSQILPLTRETETN
jgi:hypothetical protein